MLLKQKLLYSFFLTIFLNFASAQNLRSYAVHSALAQGQWYKVAISSTGIYKLDYTFIKNNCGFEPASTPFSKIAVFGNGGGMTPELSATFRYDDIQENAVWRVDNNSNGVMEEGDYILFYAQDANKWFYNSSNKSFYHQKNLYADENYYFITTTQGTGKGIASVQSEPSFTQSVSTFTDYAFHENEDYNLMNSGRRWLGDKMNAYNNSASFSFDFPNRIATDSVRYISIINNSSPYPGTFTLSVNGQTTYTQGISRIPASDYQNTDNSYTKSGSFFTSGNSLSFAYNYSNSDQTNSSNGYIDYVEVNVSRALAMNGSALLFRNPNTVGTGNVTQFIISNTNSNVKVWNVTDPVNATNIPSQLSSNTLSFNYATDSIKEFAAVDIYGSFGIPTFSGEISNQDLHGLSALDDIIVCDISMMSAAEDLAHFHSNFNGLRTKAISTDLIYNEFSSGKQDISAIRDFVKMFYDRANGDTSKQPKYLLLLGDASFDYKNRISGNTNFVPTYESVESSAPLNSYNTDDFFACLGDNDGGDMGTAQTMEIAVGRLPVDNADEAQAMVEKIKKYKSSDALGDWRNIVTVIGDETSHAGGTDFENQASSLGDFVMQNYPSYNIDKIICDAYRVQSTAGGDRYPDVNAAIINRINSGALVISYTGHGGVDNLSNARIFNMSDIQQFTNINRLPLFFTATCEFSKFDDPTKKSAGEFLVNNANGGGIASITTVRPVYITENYALQVALFNRLFQEVNGRKPTMGELLKNAK
ncbi:MAG TPA: type IX secretion system sortase PorU, partial [Chitinophagales bacterium]